MLHNLPEHCPRLFRPLAALCLAGTILMPVAMPWPGFANNAAAQQQASLDAPVLATGLVKQLYAGLGRAGIDKDAPRLAVVPVDVGAMGLPPEFAASMDLALTDALVRQNPGNWRVSSRADIAALMQEIESFESRDNKSLVQRLGTLFREAGGDYLIVTQFAQGSNGQLDIYLRAVEVENGHIAAVATQNNIDWQSDPALLDSPLLSPAAAANAAAGHFLARLAAIESIAVSGIHYGDTGFQGDFGTWWAGLLQQALIDTHGRQPGQKKLRFVRYSPADFLADRKALKGADNGIVWQDTPPPTTLETLAQQPDGRFHLSGQYWDLGTEVEIQLDMRQRNGERLTWRGAIPRRDIQVALEPAGQYLGRLRHEDGLGPVNLRLSSNHGQNPVMRIGDHFALKIRMDRPAHLACYYQQADDTVLRIFPNRYNREDRIPAGRQIAIPDGNLGYAFGVQAPAGNELIKCFATDTSALPRLPASLQGADFTPLGVTNMADVVNAWRSLRRTRLSEASMAITVTE